MKRKKTLEGQPNPRHNPKNLKNLIISSESTTLNFQFLVFLKNLIYPLLKAKIRAANYFEFLKLYFFDDFKRVILTNFIIIKLKPNPTMKEQNPQSVSKANS